MSKHFIAILLLIVFSQCGNETRPNWVKMPGGIVEYTVLKKGKEKGNGEIAIRVFGTAQKNKIVESTSLSKSDMSAFQSVLSDTLRKINFPIGTEGYCKINFSKWFDSIKKDAFKIVIFLKPDFNEKDSVKEVESLKSFNVFDSVNYISKEKSMSQWLEGGGEDFKEFIDNSIIPRSIELKLKDQFLNRQSVDSVKQILESNILYDDVRTAGPYDELFSSPVFKAEWIFKFVVF